MVVSVEEFAVYLLVAFLFGWFVRAGIAHSRETKAVVAETPDEDPRQSAGNDPLDAPATMPKGEKPSAEDMSIPSSVREQGARARREEAEARRAEE